jgi:hypothetical protein
MTIPETTLTRTNWLRVVPSEGATRNQFAEVER